MQGGRRRLRAFDTHPGATAATEGAETQPGVAYLRVKHLARAEMQRQVALAAHDESGTDTLVRRQDRKTALAGLARIDHPANSALSFPVRELDWSFHTGACVMSDTAADLARRGWKLPRNERERLVDALLESLNEPASTELDAAWAAEIERRLAACDRGEVTAIPAEEVFARARAIAR